MDLFKLSLADYGPAIMRANNRDWNRTLSRRLRSFHSCFLRSYLFRRLFFSLISIAFELLSLYIQIGGVTAPLALVSCYDSQNYRCPSTKMVSFILAEKLAVMIGHVLISSHSDGYLMRTMAFAGL